MTTLHALHGLPGSGKTALAVRLAEQLPAVRFTPDEWMIALHGVNPSVETFREQHPKIMALMWEQAARVLRVGANVVLDFGFWTRASRDSLRKRAEALGVPVIFHSVVCAEELAKERVLRRTAESRAGELSINEAAFDAFAAEFEPMGPDETHLVVLGVSATVD